MSPHDGAGGGVGDGIKVWSEAARVAASFTLLPITSGDLMHPQSKALPRTRGLQCPLFTNRTRPIELTMSASAGKADLPVAPPDFRVWHFFGHGPAALPTSARGGQSGHRGCVRGKQLDEIVHAARASALFYHLVGILWRGIPHSIVDDLMTSIPGARDLRSDALAGSGPIGRICDPPG
jgi:hypothetical protein